MSRPRGRPRQYDPEAALDAAMTLFWERGFSATSLSDLSEATGMKRPSLYAAFGDKRSIFLRTLQRFEAGMQESLGAPLMQEPDLERGLTRFYFTAIDHYLAGDPGHRGCMVVSTASVESVGDADIRELLRRTITSLDGLLSERMRRAAAQGQLASEDASARGSLATAVLHSLSVRARAGHSRRGLRKFARESVALLVAGVASE